MKFLYYFSPFYRGKSLATCYHENESPGLLMKAIMRINIVFFLILITCLNVFSKSTTAQISLHIEKGDLETVFKAIEKQTDYSFMYEVSLLKGSGVVSIDVRNAGLEEVLDEVFRGQRFYYEVISKTIVVKEKVGSGSLPVLEEKKAILIKGKVTDKQKTPLVGVSVRIKNTSTGTLTDQNGNYTIKADSNGIIIFSYVGYQTFNIKINGQTEINMTMVENASQLEEQVIKGYYTTTKDLNTGSINVIRSEALDRQPVSDPLAALQGQVPGLSLTQSTGAPGRAFTVRLRGRNSIANGNDPLFIVDGVPFNSTPLNSLNYIPGGTSYTSPLNDISTADIESITILKDADATAIYGSRGANGVILITTKRGSEGKTKVDFNGYGGVGKASKLDLLNTQEYLEMRRTAFKNDSISVRSTDYDLNGTWDQNKYTDWQDVMIGGTAGIFQVQSSISGGTKFTQFRIGGGYRNEETVFPGDNYNKKGNLLFSLNHRSENNKFTVDFTGNYITNASKLPLEDMTKYIFLAPNAPEIYNSDGSLNWENNTFQNPFSSILKRYTELTENLIGNSNISYEIIQGLLLKTSLGYNKNSLNQKTIGPFKAVNPNTFNPSSTRFITLTNSQISTWIVEPQIAFNRQLFDGVVDILFGTTFQQSSQMLLTQGGNGYSNDEQIENIVAATTKNITQYIPSEYRYNAIYGRLGYYLNDKYILNLTGRRDGSSRFGPRRQFGLFGSIGVAWLFSRENFIKENLNFLSTGKIRSSIGVSGNDKLTDYKFLSAYSSTSTSYQGYSGLNPTQLTNEFYSWEKVNKFELGLDLGFFKDGLLLGINWYRHRTNNQLVGYSLPDLTGFSNITANLPAVIQNSGLELELNGEIINKRNFKWSSSFNISIPKNKLISYPNIEGSSYATLLKVGQPLTVVYKYEYTGIDPQTGLYTFSDLNGDGLINSTFDRKFFFTGTRYFGGWNNNFTYKNFRLGILLSYVNQVGQNAMFYVRPGVLSGSGFGNQLSDVLHSTDRQPFSVSSQGSNSPLFSLFNQSSGRYTDASFIRLRNVSINWDIPSNLLGTKYIKGASLYVQGQNLLTITRYKGNDPETQSFSTLPPIKMFIAGFQFTL